MQRGNDISRPAHSGHSNWLQPSGRPEHVSEAVDRLSKLNPCLLANLHQVSQQMAPAHPQGPQFPARATLISSWWLPREIEASNAEIDHVNDITDEKLVHWRLPSSKADWVALGATRSRSCCCPGNISDPVYPYHALSAQLEFASSLPQGRWLFPTASGDQPSKAGWVATFEWVASQVGEPLETPTGARRFTGHSARATGAVHLAKTQVELWRIQLLGRWGSEVFSCTSATLRSRSYTC